MTFRRILLLRVGALLLLALALWLALDVFGLADATTKEWIDTRVRHAGMRGVALYVLAVTCLVAVGVPRQICSTLGGYVFGLWGGTLWATVGTALACAVCFGYARFLGQEVMSRKFGHKVAWFNDFLCQSPFTLVLMVRIIPLGSNFLTNILAGISRIPALPFLGGSVTGFTVQNFIFALLGSGVAQNSPLGLGLSVGLYAVSLCLGYIVYRRYRAHSAGAKAV